MQLVRPSPVQSGLCIWSLADLLLYRESLIYPLHLTQLSSSSARLVDVMCTLGCSICTYSMGGGTADELAAEKNGVAFAASVSDSDVAVSPSFCRAPDP